MDKILSIDISSSPLTALVMEVSDSVRTVVDAVEVELKDPDFFERLSRCLLYTSPSPRDKRQSRMPSSA